MEREAIAAAAHLVRNFRDEVVRTAEVIYDARALVLPDRTRLLHIGDAVAQARQFMSGRSMEDLSSDAMLGLAVTRLIGIVGEAAKNVSPTTRAMAPEIPWRVIAGTPDRVVHAYFDVDVDVLWEILTIDFPDLQEKVEQLLERVD